jgi:hypothetical protein
MTESATLTRLMQHVLVAGAATVEEIYEVIRAGDVPTGGDDRSDTEQGSWRARAGVTRQPFPT